MRGVSAKKDIPASLAVLGLVGVLGLLLYFQSPELGDQLLNACLYLLETYEDFVMVNAGILILNICCLYLFIRSTFGYHRQGSRLKTMKGEMSKQIRTNLLSAVVPSIIGVVSFYLVNKHHGWGFKPIGSLLHFEVSKTIELLINLNLAVLVTVLVYLINSATKKVKFGRSTLPEFPKLHNAIVLGSSGDKEEEIPEWKTMQKRGLNGNILITGSIGTGKSQGTMLPYLEQIIQNFSPKPAVLAIDPKRTFIQELKSLLHKSGHCENIVSLSLDGDHTFNPVYVPNVLRGGQSMEVAQLIRAAMVNTIESGSDSSFWENQAFNLAKNAIVACAANDEYYTLNDIYSVITKAADDEGLEDVVEKLDDALEGKRFSDEEELFNIKIAKEFFKGEFGKLDSKLKTSILSTLTNFLNQFREYGASKTFCPRKDALTVTSVDEMVDNSKFTVLDIENEGLSKAMGTFLKLHFQRSILGRNASRSRKKDRLAVIAIDEYQDVVTVGNASSSGDDGFLAKSREANASMICASQSVVSIMDKIRREKAAKTLIQNFRTKIVGNSSDLETIRLFQNLYGKDEEERRSHSISESSQRTSRNLVEGGLQHEFANVMESMSTSQVKDFPVTGKELSRLDTFECFAQIYDGVKTTFSKLYLKPYFLPRKERNLKHSKILEKMSLAALLIGVLWTGNSHAFPNVCTVVNTSEFRSCLSFNVGVCMCGWPIPRPCLRFEYYVPQTFIETMPDRKSTFFNGIPGAEAQLATLGKGLPFGTEDDQNTHSYQSHAIAVPFASVPYSALPCGGARVERTCFDAMSEHTGDHWNTGSKDVFQPQFLAWQASPKMCLVKGAAEGLAGGSHPAPNPIQGNCSVPVDFLPHFPPSSRAACNAWGFFYPINDSHMGPSQTISALMIASRLRSLGTEVFQSVPTDADEKFQMITPHTSACFQEGTNPGFLETAKRVNDMGRIGSTKLKGHLFVVWKKVSCCRDIVQAPTTVVLIEGMKAACAGIDAL